MQLVYAARLAQVALWRCSFVYWVEVKDTCEHSPQVRRCIAPKREGEKSPELEYSD